MIIVKLLSICHFFACEENLCERESLLIWRFVKQLYITIFSFVRKEENESGWESVFLWKDKRVNILGGVFICQHFYLFEIGSFLFEYCRIFLIPQFIETNYIAKQINLFFFLPMLRCCRVVNSCSHLRR